MKVCTFCKNTGHTGARFTLLRGEVEHAVHKYCGEQLIKGAPEGEVVRLVNTGELRREQETARIKSFWESKFQKAGYKGESP